MIAVRVPVKRCGLPACLTLMLVALGAGCVSHAIIKPFTTDECSCSAEGTQTDSTKWCDCCVQHDIAYWQGGTRAERRTADRAFRACIAATGEAKYARKAYHAVRVFGSAWLPTPWRWGYGWGYHRAYRPLTPAEQDSVKATLLRDPIENTTAHTCGK